MTHRQVNKLFALLAMALGGIANVAFATEPKAEKDAGQMRGPLDVHADWIRQIVNTLDLTDIKRTEVAQIVDEGHAAWRFSPQRILGKSI